MKWGVHRADRRTKKTGSPHRAKDVVTVTPVTKSKSVVRGGQNAGSPHKAEDVVTVTPAANSGGVANVSVESEELNELKKRGKDFISSLFDREHKINIGGSYSISVKKKGKISKAIESGLKWIKNLFGKG